MYANRVVLTANILLAACGGEGNVEITVLPRSALAENAKLLGVLFYPPQYVKLRHEFTTRVDDAGKVVGTADRDQCQRVIQKEEVTLMADLTQPMLVSNNSGDMSAAKFSVTLNNGLLASVNAEPTQKPSEIISAVTGGLTSVVLPAARAVLIPQPVRPGPAAPPPACNAGPRLAGFEKYELSSSK